MSLSLPLSTLDDLELAGQRVIVRVDFNVPVGDDNQVDECEDFRMRAALPTLKELAERGCKIILLTHFGRPQPVTSLTDLPWDLGPIHQHLEQLLGKQVATTRSFYGQEVNEAIHKMKSGECLLLPNVRLNVGEKSGDQEFATHLSTLADGYVNEAFSASHRGHASMAVLPNFLPACAGRRTAQEVELLSKLKDNPTHPYVAIVSGAKVKTKVGLLKDLLRKVDRLCVGGQIANVFLASQGIGSSAHHDPHELTTATELLTEAGDKIVLPRDVVVGVEDDPDSSVIRNIEDLGTNNFGIWDIGPKTVEKFLEVCAPARTILWNGPMGKFEVKAYRQGTYSLAKGLAGLKSFRVVGGGDTVSALEQLKLTENFDHVSVGGGAMLAFLEGKEMPGLRPLFKHQSDG